MRFPLTLRQVLQAYGKAVVDEAPVFVLTNHNVTVFFKRSQDVRDTCLWASEPFWISETDPPACAMWAHALQQAEELRSWKPLLPCADVPFIVEEQHAQTLQQRIDTQRQRLAGMHLLSTEQSSAWQVLRPQMTARPPRTSESTPKICILGSTMPQSVLCGNAPSMPVCAPKPAAP